MSNHIGENSVIGPNVKLGKNTTIGNNVILEGKITIEDGTRIDHNCIIRGNIVIGKNNWIYPSCVMGTGPLHNLHKENKNKVWTEKGKIRIGDNNVIREFSTVHMPIKKETIIGSNCYLLAYAHISHDNHIHDNITISNAVMLGGHVEVFDNVIIGYSNSIHQFCKIGAYSMIGMGNSIVKDVLPFSLINRQKFTKINAVGLQRNKIKKKDIQGIQKTYEENFPTSVAKTWYEKEIKNFVKKSTRKYYMPEFV